MAQIKLNVVQDTCLGYKVYRGCVKACDLEPATWIDFYDEELNPLGYQRPFNEKRSQKAADYAAESKAFWPESILAIRDNAEVVDDNDKVIAKFNPVSAGSKFGELVVDYNRDRVLMIGSKSYK